MLAGDQTMNKIDFVLPWVDGDDPDWQRQRAAYANDAYDSRAAAQYRDWGTLKYWFRAVEKYAPWVNSIFFITCGQTPKWLNTHHPKLRVVTHSDYIPANCLPTFSANPIELNLHRIEGLAEQFVYFNDDTFLTAPVSEEDFFRDGLPCDAALLSSLIPSVKNEVITYILFNDLLLINSNFSKRDALKNQPGKWFSLRYGSGLFRNLYYLPVGKFPGFIDPHLPNSFLKSSFEDVWKAEGDYLDDVCKNRFRTARDVNQYLMRYWQLVTGRFVPRNPKIGASFTVGIDDRAIENAVFNQRFRMICINDNPSLDDIDGEKQWLLSLFERMLLEKSSFEK